MINPVALVVTKNISIVNMQMVSQVINTEIYKNIVTIFSLTTHHFM